MFYRADWDNLVVTTNQIPGYGFARAFLKNLSLNLDSTKYKQKFFTETAIEKARTAIKEVEDKVIRRCNRGLFSYYFLQYIPFSEPYTISFLLKNIRQELDFNIVKSQNCLKAKEEREKEAIIKATATAEETYKKAQRNISNPLEFFVPRTNLDVKLTVIYKKNYYRAAFKNGEIEANAYVPFSMNNEWIPFLIEIVNQFPVKESLSDNDAIVNDRDIATFASFSAHKAHYGNYYKNVSEAAFQDLIKKIMPAVIVK